MKKAEIAMLNEGLPEYIQVVDKKTIQVIYTDWSEKPTTTKITLEDCIKYYHRDARNISSGFRQIGSIGGDWRYIDNIAHDALEIFKKVNLGGLKKESSKYGMTLRGA